MAQPAPAIADSISSFVRAVSAMIPVDRVILFGSYAMGAAGADSDIDLAIVSPAFGQNPWDDRQILFGAVFRERLDSRIEPHPLTPADLQRTSGWIKTEVLDKGILVYSRRAKAPHGASNASCISE
ncbi:MAG: nucleotidyltransferase domain-containing protein [Clostridia bacterium]|nr:nucleotidyltransferase domain-containing protein [Clostridia bacterium]